MEYQTFTFTANGASDVLSFLAQGTPGGEPPFALLDGVTLNSATPEPGTLTLIAGAAPLAAAGFVRKRMVR
jgi:hypothetical protein